MDTDQLRQFLAVARLGNITRAAEEFGLSQPALSRSMQRLEDEFGRPLLERQSRAVVLTEAGEMLRGRAEEVLALLDDTKTQLADDGRSGRLKIGAIPTIAPYHLPGFLAGFGAEFPEATLVVHEDTTDNLLSRVKQGDLDLAVLALPINAKYVDTLTLFEEELLLVCPPRHALTECERLDTMAIEPYPFVLLGEAHCLADSVVSFCRQRSFQPLVVERTSQLTTIQELVALGHGVSMMPAMARRLDQSERRVYRAFDGEKPTRTIAAAWNPYRFQSKLLVNLRERLAAYGAGPNEGS